MYKAILVAATLTLPTLSHAGILDELGVVKATEVKCQDASTSNMEMKACEWEAYADADAILNKQYKAIVQPLKVKTGDAEMDKYNAEVLKRLLASERAWITYRDAECELQGTEMLFGTGEGLIVGGCLFSETAKRVESLAELFQVK